MPDGIRRICKKCNVDQTKAYYKRVKDDPDFIKKNNEASRAWRKKNPDYSNVYTQVRRAEDPNFKIAFNLRARLRLAVKLNIKAGSSVRDLGCSIDEFKVYIASKFQPGMTWENYGQFGWHIDHIQPLCSFDLTNREQFLKANHYTNLQPLWATDNHKKNKKLGSR